MRKTLIALMFAAALPTVAMAMPEGGHHMMGGAEHGRHHSPYSQLDLTQDQRQQIGKLMGEQKKERRDITERYLNKLPAADQKAMKEEIKAKQDKTQADIRSLLKPDQQKQFDEMKKKQDERRAEWAEFKAWKEAKGNKAQ